MQGRYNREEDDEDMRERRANGRGASRREYDEREREFLERSRRRDEGNYGRAYGNRARDVGTGGPRYEDDEGPRRRFGGGFEERRARMGWGRWEEEGDAERRRDDDFERRGYWSRSNRGEFGGRQPYGRGEDDDYGRGRAHEDEFPARYGGRMGGRGPRYEDEDDGPRFGGRSGGRGERFGSEEFEEDRDHRRGRAYEETYRGGRHVGGNIGQSQMDYEVDYNEEGYRRAGRGGSRWEDEDVVTAPRGRSGGSRRGEQASVFERDFEETRAGTGRRNSGNRGRTSEGETRGKASQRTRTSLGKDRLGAGARKKSRVRREEDEGNY